MNTELVTLIGNRAGRIPAGEVRMSTHLVGETPVGAPVALVQVAAADAMRPYRDEINAAGRVGVVGGPLNEVACLRDGGIAYSAVPFGSLPI